MRWRNRHQSAAPARPKVRRLSDEQREQVLRTLNRGVEQSPVLRAFQVKVRPLRGRFYLYGSRGPNDETTSEWGRITPVEDPADELLLEVSHSKGRWYEVASGSARKVINAVANDERGTFHGLGSLNKSLCNAGEKAQPAEAKPSGRTNFKNGETGEKLSVPESLYYYFGLPVPVIARPAIWYSRHRSPSIAEYTKDRTRVLVRFMSMSSFGDSFGGTCLYAQRDGQWEAYTIRPNQSDSIATAEAWLVKRGWEDWC